MSLVRIRRKHVNVIGRRLVFASMLIVMGLAYPATICASTAVLNADFNADALNSPPNATLPGYPAGDYLALHVSSGTIRVRSAIGSLVNKPVEMNQVPGIGSIALLAYLAPHANCNPITVSWRSLARSNDVFFLACGLRSSDGLILGCVEYRSGGVLTYNSVGVVGPTLPIPYVPDQDQLFTIVVDLINQTTSLSIDSVPVPGFQDVPFPEAGTNLAQIGFDGGGTGAQVFAVDDIHAEAVRVVPAIVDIEPTSCPNPFELKPDTTPVLAEESSRFDVHAAAASLRDKVVFSVAVLGSDDFDVANIDPETVAFNGVPALRWSLKDVATPVGEGAEECECTIAGPDGYMDLTLKFSRAAIAATLGAVNDGDYIALTLTGELVDGTVFGGSDCVWIRLEGKGSISSIGEPPSAEGYPNPFNAASTIRYTLGEPGDVNLSVFNVLGQRVTTLVDGFQLAGEHSVSWSAGNAPSGMYFYRLQTSGAVITRKMMLLK